MWLYVVIRYEYDFFYYNSFYDSDMLLNWHSYRACLLRQQQEYLACVEMSIDLDDDLVIFIWCLFPGDHHFSCCQVLELIHLETHFEYFRRK